MNFDLLIHFPLALLPGLCWLFALALRRTQDRESRRQILKIFVLGMVMCVPAGEVNSSISAAAGLGGAGLLSKLALYMLVVGPNEEGLKFLIVYSEVYRKWRFRGELDGVIFATASALGFATYENATYMQRFGIQVLMLRAWATALAHICFSAVFGYYLGLAKSKKYRAGPCIAEGLALAAFLHGAYDFLVTYDDRLLYPCVATLVAIYGLLAWGRMRPILSIVAPRFTAPEDRPRQAAGYQRRRFALQTKPILDGRVRATLEAFDSLDESVRLSAIPEALVVLDPRLADRIDALTHDPVPAVRAAAVNVQRELKRRLRELA